MRKMQLRSVRINKLPRRPSGFTVAPGFQFRECEKDVKSANRWWNKLSDFAKVEVFEYYHIDDDNRRMGK